MHIYLNFRLRTMEFLGVLFCEVVKLKSEFMYWFMEEQTCIDCHQAQSSVMVDRQNPVHYF